MFARPASSLVGCADFEMKRQGFGSSAELRIDYGPGYRVYFQQRGSLLVLLLAGGTKSTQESDIAKAKKLAGEWVDEH